MLKSEGVLSLRFHSRGDLQLDTVRPLPCGPDEVRLKIAYCGICGTDIHEFQGGPIFPPQPGSKNQFTEVELPVTMGHEMSGTVIEKGPAVQDLDVGQEVCVNPSLDDRHFGADPCPSCQAGRINLCKRWCCYGLNANGGGFSEEIVVKSYNCLVLPEGVSPKAGQDALVLGAGPIGLAILLGLRAQGVNKVVVSEVAEQRALQAKKFGADMVVNPLKNAVTANDRLQSTLDTALAATKPGGTIFNVAIHEKPLMLNLNDIAILEKKLLGGICYTHEDWERVLDALKKGDLPFEQMITAIVPLKDVVHGGFQELIRNKAAHVKILIQPTAA